MEATAEVSASIRLDGKVRPTGLGPVLKAFFFTEVSGELFSDDASNPFLLCPLWVIVKINQSIKRLCCS